MQIKGEREAKRLFVKIISRQMEKISHKSANDTVGPDMKDEVLTRLQIA